jgi:hypothetical protein
VANKALIACMIGFGPRTTDAIRDVANALFSEG